MSLGRDRPLSKPLQVSGPLRCGCVLLSFGVSAVWCCVVPNVIRNPSPANAATAAALIALPGMVALVIELARYRWLVRTADGFTLLRLGGFRRAYTVEQLTGVSQWTGPRTNRGTRRRVVLDVAPEAGGGTVVCAYTIPPDAADPLGPLVEQVTRELTRRAAASSRIDGAGWHLDRDGLHLHPGPRRGSYPLNNLTYVAALGGRLRVYRVLEAEPLVSLPLASRNAEVLGRVLRERMERRGTRDDPIPGRPLGRRLYTVRGREAQVGWAFAPAGALAAAFFFSFYPLWGTTFFLPHGCIALLAMNFGAWLVWRGSSLRLDYHQFGVAQPGRGRSLLFADVATMVWTAKTVRLEPRPGTGGDTIDFRTDLPSSDPTLTEFRDAIAAAIAQGWWAQLTRARRPVAWTVDLLFLPDQLECRASRVVWAGKTIQVPYRVTSFAMTPWGVDLFVLNEPRPVLRMPFGTENLWPGLILLMWLQQRDRVNTPAAPPDDRFTTRPRPPEEPYEPD
jgi:hypothetical protein